MIRKFGTYGIVGVGIGIIIFTLCCWANGTSQISLVELSLCLAGSALCGGSARIYECKTWKLPVKVGVHMGLCLAVTLAANVYLNLGEGVGIGELLWDVVPTFVLIYGVIFSVMYLRDWWNAKEINEKLKRG